MQRFLVGFWFHHHHHHHGYQAYSHHDKISPDSVINNIALIQNIVSTLLRMLDLYSLTFTFFLKSNSIGFVSDLSKPLSKEVMMQTVATDQSSGNYNKSMGLIDSMNMKNKCNQCDYAASQAGNLRTHMKTHTGEKSNKCNYCDYASYRADSLRTHMKRHTGEK